MRGLRRSQRPSVTVDKVPLAKEELIIVDPKLVSDVEEETSFSQDASGKDFLVRTATTTIRQPYGATADPERESYIKKQLAAIGIKYDKAC